MVRITTSLSCLVGLVGLAASAAPSTRGTQRSDKTVLGSARKIVDASPKHYNNHIKSYTFATNVDPKALGIRGLTPADAALKLATTLIEADTGSCTAQFQVRSDSYYDEGHGLHHIYVKQSVHGLQVFNVGLHALVSEEGDILSYSHNLYAGQEPQIQTNAAPVSTCQGPNASKRSQMAFTQPIVNSVISTDAALYGFLAVASPDPAMSSAFAGIAHASHGASHLSAIIDFTRSHKIKNVPTTTGDISTSFAYILTNDGCLVLTHKLEVPLEDNWYEAYVDALSGEVRAVADWVSPGSAGKFSLARPDFSSYETPLVSKVEQGLKLALNNVLRVGEDLLTQAKVSSQKEEKETKEPSYRVFQWGENDPSEGRRTYESARHDPEVSPFGWHAFPSTRRPFDVSSDKGLYRDGNLTKFKDTRGNNVFVSWGGRSSEDAWSLTLPRPEGEIINGSRHFSYPYPWRKFDVDHKALDPKNYSLASQTQLFYTINEYHDLLHHYGFDGAAGNGEEYSDKGKDGDAIIAFAQSTAGQNNADMATPPDGQRGRMRMYTWSGQPQRDGSFESGIVLHEYTHFVSTRLTGGPSDSSCLGFGESGGMGEGWGDIIATMARDRNGSTLAFSMGEWASNHTGGIRKWPYSRNITLDPDTYETLNKPGYWAVHQIGSVWATIILDVVDHAMEMLGFTPDLFPPSKDASKEEQRKFYLDEEELSSLRGVKTRKSKKRVPRHGNTLLLQLLIDGMKIQPCRPDFLAARDAIIKADEVLTGGANECLLKHSFAKRGLGLDARVIGSTPWGGGIRTNGHQVPSYCNGTHHT